MADGPTSPDSANSAYRRGLALLGRRELSEAQLRQRLARRGYDPADIDAAIARLTADGSLDDARTAGAIARTELSVHGHGRLRIRRRLAAAGIDAPLAERALDEAFRDQDADQLLRAALTRRLRERDRIADDRERRRLYRYLVGRGFEPERVLRLLETLPRGD